MSTVNFQIVSDRYGAFHVDSLPDANGQLNCYITRDQYSSIIMKINQRLKQYKLKIKNLSFSVCTIAVCLVVITIMLLVIALERKDYLYSDLITVLICIWIMCVIVGYCSACFKSIGEKAKQFKKLQSDIQKIADEQFMTVHQVNYSKWTMEKIDDRTSGKKFKLTVVFRRRQPRPIPATLFSIREPIDSRSIRLDPPSGTSTAAALVLNLEQVPTPLNNEQHSQYEIAPSTPPPPSYNKVVFSFSQAIFSDCPNCSGQKCVYNAKYCTQCGQSLLT